MARWDLVFLTGYVIKKPEIRSDENTQYALCSIKVVRDERDVGDGKTFLRSDSPLIMCCETSIVSQMKEWKENDIVDFSGRISSKRILKTSHCEYCGEKNTVEDVLVYIEPTYISKITHCNTQEEAHNMLSSQRETSNQVYLHGTVSSDPDSIISDEGITITQYQIALDTKYIINNEKPEPSIEHPWVISYGKNATEDKRRLKVGSVICMNACLQIRSVQKHTLCESCGQEYTWEDQKMEFVPYVIEYNENLLTEQPLA